MLGYKLSPLMKNTRILFHQTSKLASTQAIKNGTGIRLPKILKRYSHNVLVRSMTEQDAAMVQKWWCRETYISKYDLDICLKVTPQELEGYYILERKGEPIASMIWVPWKLNGGPIYYGSYYYVVPSHRQRGYGSLLEHQFVKEETHFSSNILVGDTVIGKSSKGHAKHGAVGKFPTGRYVGQAVRRELEHKDFTIVKASTLDFNQLVAYDNACFVSSDDQIRRDFLKQWIKVPGGATYAAVDLNNTIIGFGCRRPALQPGYHGVGPLYANNDAAAEAILAALCNDVAGQCFYMDVYRNHEGAMTLLGTYKMELEVDMMRMYMKQDPCEPQQRVYAFTSFEICGF